jgi:hypothetical protein
MIKPDERRWLIITPEIQVALLVALIRRAGGTVSVGVSEVLATADITWAIEATQDLDAPDQLLVRLRDHPLLIAPATQAPAGESWSTLNRTPAPCPWLDEGAGVFMSGSTSSRNFRMGLGTFDILSAAPRGTTDQGVTRSCSRPFRRQPALRAGQHPYDIQAIGPFAGSRHP